MESRVPHMKMAQSECHHSAPAFQTVTSATLPPAAASLRLGRVIANGCHGLLLAALAGVLWTNTAPALGFAVEGHITAVFLLPDGKEANRLEGMFQYSWVNHDYSTQIIHARHGTEIETVTDRACIYLSQGATMLGGLPEEQGGSTTVSGPAMAVIASHPRELSQNCLMRVIWLTFTPERDTSDISARYQRVRCGVLLEGDNGLEVYPFPFWDQAANRGGVAFVSPASAILSDGQRPPEEQVLALYETFTTTNVAGRIVPVHASFKVYYPSEDGTRAVSEHYAIRVDKFIAAPLSVPLPSPEGRVDVTDIRFTSQKLGKIVPLTYTLTNAAWLPKEDPFLLQRFEAFEATEMGKRTTSPRNRSRRHIVLVSLVLLSAAAVVGVLKTRTRTRDSGAEQGKNNKN
jgi:hypothetical protein